MDEAENCDRIALISDGLVIACDSVENLKKRYMKGILFEVECDNVMKALEVLRNVPAFKEVALYGLYVHVVVDRESDADVIRKALASKNIKVKRIATVTPSLEDVFVSLVEEQQRKKEAAGKK
jgi:ABC-2 type transport system ATP-binding protein